MKLFALLLIFIAAANAVDIIVETSPTFDVTPLSEPEVILDEKGLHWEENSWGSTNCIFKDDIGAIECTFGDGWPVFSFQNLNFKLYGGTLVINMKVLYPDHPFQIQIHHTNTNYENIYSFRATNDYADYAFRVPMHSYEPIYRFAIAESSTKGNTIYIKKIVYYPNNIQLPEDEKKLLPCIISLSDNYSSCRASKSCTADNYGYYLQDGFLINLSENGCEVISNPLPGYYVDKNKPEKYIKCTNSGCETISEPVESKNCSSDYDGQLIKNEKSVVGLCTKINKLSKEEEGTYVVNSERYTMIPFATTETNYLVHHAIDGDVFNFNRKNDNVYYVVKSNKDAIVFNPEISETDHCADKDGKLMDRVTDFCSNDSSGMYYTCVNGKCTSEYQTKIGHFEENKEKECTCTGTTASDNCCCHAAGYYLSGIDLYEYDSERKCTKVNNPVDGYYWNDHQYNQLVMCIGGSCSAVTPKLKADITDNSDYESQFVDTGYNLIFNGETLSSILSKQSNKYKINGNTNSAFNDPTKVYFIKIDNNSLIVDVNGSDDTSSLCENGICSPKVNKIVGNLAFYGRGQTTPSIYWNDIDKVRGSNGAKVIYPNDDYDNSVSRDEEDAQEVINLAKNRPLTLFLPGKKDKEYSKLIFNINGDENYINLYNFHKIKSEMKLVPPTANDLISEGYTCESIGLSCTDLSKYDFEANKSEWLSKVNIKLFLGFEEEAYASNYYEIENLKSPTNEWSEVTGDINRNHIDNLNIVYDDFVFRNYGTMPVYIFIGNTVFLKKEPTVVVDNGVIQNGFEDWSWYKNANEERHIPITYFVNEIYEDDPDKKTGIKLATDIPGGAGFYVHIVKGISASPEAVSIRIRPLYDNHFRFKIDNKKEYILNEDYLEYRNCQIPIAEESEILIDTRSLVYSDPKNMLTNDISGFYLETISDIYEIKEKLVKERKENEAENYKDVVYIYSMTLHHTYPKDLSKYAQVKVNDDGPACNIKLETYEDWADPKHPIIQWPDDISFETILKSENSYVIENEDEELPINPDPEPTIIDDPNAKPGYYKIGKTNEYRQCDGTECKEATIESACNASNIGKLFTKDGEVALCLNYFDNQPIWTSLTNSGKYFIKYNTNNIFGLSNGQYGLINITNGSITLSEEESKAIHYRYTKGDQKVLLEKRCTSSEINEFSIVESNSNNNVYTLSCTDQDTTGLCKKT